jgi:hypothetical protein
MQMKFLAVVDVDQSTTDQIFCISHVGEKWECSGTMYQLFFVTPKTFLIQLGMQYYVIFLLNVLIEFDIPMKLVTLIKMSFNKPKFKRRDDFSLSCRIYH